MDHGCEKRLRSISGEEFVRRLKADTTLRPLYSKYALFLGAGCSVSSGIPAARALVLERWLPALHQVRAPKNIDVMDWAREEFGIENEILPSDAYGRVMVDLFPQPTMRQEETEELCSRVRPGFGYATLAQLVSSAGTAFNVVLTTNFDDLAADALYLFTSEHPLVIHHGSLSTYIRPTTSRPVIVKLHGHHQYSPLNTVDETQSIDPGLANAVRNLLHDRGLIVIGYRGNDSGIRDLLTSLPMEALPRGIYWISGHEPSGLLREWLESRSAIWVEQRDFDELMVLIRDAFELPMPDDSHISKVFDNVLDRYIRISADIRGRSGAHPEETALQEATKRVNETISDWAVYELRAQRYKSSAPDRAANEYEKGLRVLPDCVPLHGNYANLLKDMGKHEAAEQHYQRALELDPDAYIPMHDYAIFLWRYKGEIESARKFIDRAKSLDPGDPVRTSNYGNFAWLEDRNAEEAEKLLAAGASMSTNESEPLRQFAVFSAAELKDKAQARALIEEALHRQPDDVAAQLFHASLAELLWDRETALSVLERAYARDEDDPEVAIALASHLSRHRKNMLRAEFLYRRVVGLAPGFDYQKKRRALHLVEFGWFLGRGARENEGYKCMEQARQLDPNSAFIASRIASYWAYIFHAPEKAKEILDEALAKFGEEATLVGEKGSLVLQFDQNVDEARALLEKAIQLDPNQPALQVNLSAIWFTDGRTDEAIRLCDHAIDGAGWLEAAVSIEGFFYLFMFGPDEARIKCLVMLKWMLCSGDRSLGWNFDRVIHTASILKRSHHEWFPVLGGVINGTRSIDELLDWELWNTVQTPKLV